MRGSVWNQVPDLVKKLAAQRFHDMRPTAWHEHAMVLMRPGAGQNTEGADPHRWDDARALKRACGSVGMCRRACPEAARRPVIMQQDVDQCLLPAPPAALRRVRAALRCAARVRELLRQGAVRRGRA